MKTKQLILTLLALMTSITAFADVPQGNITFADPAVKAICVECYDSNNDGEVSYREAAYNDLGYFGNAFQGNTEITSFDEFQYFIREHLFSQNAFSGCTNLRSIILPEGFYGISDYAFSGCSSLMSITIPSSVTWFGQYAFNSCTSLTSINIPENATQIGDYCFNNCTVLRSLTIPATMRIIGTSAFRGCSSLSSIIVDGGNSLYDSRENCNALIKTSTNTLILGCQNTVIPSSVPIIGDYAFYNSRLTSLTIPNSVTTIGKYAFSRSSLTSLTIPNSVTTIGEFAFAQSGLTSLTIPSSVTDLGSFAFSLCRSLTSINSLEGFTEIPQGTFYGCVSLTSVTIPSSVTSIGSQAFDSAGLTSITIPNSVTSLGYDAFNNCDNLTSMTINIATPPTLYGQILYPKSNCAKATLYVPYGSKAAYQAAQYWQEFGTIVELPNPNAITVGSTGYATFCSPKAMDFTDVDGIKAYIASGFEPSTGTLVLTRAKKVPAGEGLYIVGTPGTSATYNVPETTTDMVYSNLLKGVTSATTISPTDGENTNFILANGTHGVGFYTLSDAGEIAAGKAYLQLPTASLSSNVKAITFAFSDDSETGINETKDVREVKEVYNLQGQRVSQPKHGLYIINGKKVIIK